MTLIRRMDCYLKLNISLKSMMSDSYTVGYHTRSPSAPPDLPHEKEKESRIVVETHCMAPEPREERREEQPKETRESKLRRRFRLVGMLAALILYRLMVVAIIVCLGTYAYNIKTRNPSIEQVYRTSWALTIVSVVLLLAELGVILFYSAYISRKVRGYL